MSGYLISAGSYVKSLTDVALRYGEEIGYIKAGLGSNRCQIFHALDYIRKVQARRVLGKKRKTMRC